MALSERMAHGRKPCRCRLILAMPAAAALQRICNHRTIRNEVPVQRCSVLCQDTPAPPTTSRVTYKRPATRVLDRISPCVVPRVTVSPASKQ